MSEQVSNQEIDYKTLSDAVSGLSAGDVSQEEFQSALLNGILVLPLRMQSDDPNAPSAPLTVQVGDDAMVLAFTEPAEELAAKVQEVTNTFAPVPVKVVVKGMQPGFGLLIESKNGAVGVRKEEVDELKKLLADDE